MSLSFKNPDSFYRPWPLFSLNGDYSSEQSVQSLIQTLKSLKGAGFGGVYLHPRPGLMTEYLSSEWFSLIERLIHACVELGLRPALYDENSYPSGHAGGHVTAAQPELQAYHIIPVYGSGCEFPDETVRAFQWDTDRPGKAIDTAHKAQSWLAFVLRGGFISEWHGCQPTASLLNPETCRQFLQKTHEAYKRNLSSEAWNHLAAIFTDEPHLIADQHGIEGIGLPFTDGLRSEFLDRWGYAIEDSLPELFFDLGTYRRTRFHFYECCHELFQENWAKPLGNWARKNGLALTGHYLEHDWPVPYATPGQMELLAEMDWPGTDQLLGFPLSGHSMYDIQNHPPSEAGSEPHLLYYLKQASSVANQLDKKRVMNECWGASGHAADPSDWYRIGNFLLVNGVNHLVPHHCMPNIRGTRKHDHPPFFSAQSPWFSSILPMIDELSRVCEAMSWGQTQNRVLLLDAQSTGFVLAAKGIYSTSGASNKTSIEKQAALKELREPIVRLAEQMAWRQIDFDIGDEYIMQRHGQISSEGALTVGNQSYKLIVWPPGMQNLRSASVKLLHQFLIGGGVIVGAFPDKIQVDGVESSVLQQWLQYHSEQILSVEPVRIPDLVAELIPPRVQLSGESRGLLHLRRVSGRQSRWFFVNCSSKTRRFKIEDSGIRQNEITEVDLANGQVIPVAESWESGCEIELPPGSTRLFISGITVDSDCLLKPRVENELQPTNRSQLAPYKTERTDPNVLVLDFCELITGEQSHGLLETRSANRKLWAHNGLNPEGWSRTIQFKQDVIKRAAAAKPGEPVTLKYVFETDPKLQFQELFIVVEHPWHENMHLNGSPLSHSLSEKWLDPSFMVLEAGKTVIPGRNELILRRSTFNADCEVANVYVVGNFSLSPAEMGFRLSQEIAPTIGSWKESGSPFYDRGMRYHFETKRGGTLCIHVGAWKGSWLSISNSEGQTSETWPGRDLSLHSKGPAKWVVTVSGLPANLFGPWHRRQPDLLKFDHPSDWQAPLAEVEPCSGKDYQLLDLGLLNNPLFIPH